MFRCPRWSNIREVIYRLVLGAWSGEQKDRALAKWRSTNEMATATINFAIATSRLEDWKEESEESGDVIMSNSSRVEKVGDRVKYKRQFTRNLYHSSPASFRPPTLMAEPKGDIVDAQNKKGGKTVL